MNLLQSCGFGRIPKLIPSHKFTGRPELVVVLGSVVVDVVVVGVVVVVVVVVVVDVVGSVPKISHVDGSP
jgi:hypothetical protein